MNCTDALRIAPGITSVIGSGGKTTLLRTLAGELAARGGTVVLTTTTHFQAFESAPLITSDDEGEVARALDANPIVCVAARAQEGKLSASPIPCRRLAELAGYVLVEADGSRRLPLKAHADYEPVIPEGSGRTIQVLGASGFSGRVRAVAHRAELFCGLTGCDMDDVATPELVARGLTEEMRRGLIAPDALVVNQAETDAAASAARELAAHLPGMPVCYGSIRRSELRR